MTVDDYLNANHREALWAWNDLLEAKAQYLLVKENVSGEHKAFFLEGQNNNVSDALAKLKREDLIDALTIRVRVFEAELELAKRVLGE